MENIPKDVEKYLVKDEIIEKHFGLSGCKVYASDKRLFIKKGNIVRDIDYGHISSIEFKVQRSWGLVIGGIFLALFPWLLVAMLSLRFGPVEWMIFMIPGVVMLIAGLVPREQVELSVVGLALPVKLLGQRSALDSVFKLVREKRM